jgi:hypothetical protein
MMKNILCNLYWVDLVIQPVETGAVAPLLFLQEERLKDYSSQ